MVLAVIKSVLMSLGVAIKTAVTSQSQKTDIDHTIDVERDAGGKVTDWSDASIIVGVPSTVKTTDIVKAVAAVSGNLDLLTTKKGAMKTLSLNQCVPRLKAISKVIKADGVDNIDWQVFDASDSDDDDDIFGDFATDEPTKAVTQNIVTLPSMTVPDVAVMQQCLFFGGLGADSAAEVTSVTIATRDSEGKVSLFTTDDAKNWDSVLQWANKVYATGILQMAGAHRWQPANGNILQPKATKNQTTKAEQSTLTGMALHCAIALEGEGIAYNGEEPDACIGDSLTSDNAMVAQLTAAIEETAWPVRKHILEKESRHPEHVDTRATFSTDKVVVTDANMAQWHQS